MEYSSDKWVVLKFTSDTYGTIYKVFAGWSGSYLQGQKWKLNSGITSVVEDEVCYLFYGYSGSVYSCHKHGYGMNSIMLDVFASWEIEIDNGNGMTMVVMPEDTNFMKLIEKEEDGKSAV
jgi:hypothetical protein